MNLPRSAGVLLHVASLPGGEGIGDAGPEAYRFVDWLAAAGQTIWQILPLGPTGFGDSPYASMSAFAGNPDFISLQLLAQDGLLQPHEIAGGLPSDRVDYRAVSDLKSRALRQAFQRFSGGPEYEDFCQRAAYWLDDYAHFKTLKDPDSNTDRYERFVQHVFDRQWSALRRYANERNISILGDIPIFVADGSADVLMHPTLFHLDQDQRPTVVAGVPPDAFSETGQRWGNPLYRWEAMAQDGYQWWSDRLRRTLELVDLVRVDHFRAFAAYWAVPASEETAVHGEWRRGPGLALFKALAARTPALPIVVEDLGLITTDVISLRDELGFPGMKVLQFAFDGHSDNPYLPHNYTADWVVYTGTHDNDTTTGWYESLPEDQRHRVRSYLGTSGNDIAWDLLRAAHASVAAVAIAPAQDLLSLGNDARLNFPGKAAGNWAWRVPTGALNDTLAGRVRELTGLYGRLPEQRQARERQVLANYPFGLA